MAYYYSSLVPSALAVENVLEWLTQTYAICVKHAQGQIKNTQARPRTSLKHDVGPRVHTDCYTYSRQFYSLS